MLAIVPYQSSSDPDPAFTLNDLRGPNISLTSPLNISLTSSLNSFIDWLALMMIWTLSLQWLGLNPLLKTTLMAYPSPVGLVRINPMVWNGLARMYLLQMLFFSMKSFHVDGKLLRNALQTLANENKMRTLYVVCMEKVESLEIQAAVGVMESLMQKVEPNCSRTSGLLIGTGRGILCFQTQNCSQNGW